MERLFGGILCLYCKNAVYCIFAKSFFIPYFTIFRHSDVGCRFNSFDVSEIDLHLDRAGFGKKDRLLSENSALINAGTIRLPRRADHETT